MKTHNPENERIKRPYFEFLREAEGQNTASIDKVAEAIHRFESYTKFRSFKRFHVQQAVAFKRHLSEQLNARTGKPLSRATIRSILNALKKFFLWLAGQPGYRARIAYADAQYFNLTDKEARIAKARRETKVPTLELILHVLRSMPASTDIERRNRALIAFTILTGARDSAIASLKLKHVDLGEGCVHQDAREVKTKFSKSFTTWFFPVGDKVLELVEDWVAYLSSELLWGLDDPLFPRTRVAQNDNLTFEAVGLDRSHWSNAGPIRKIFKSSFEAAGLPYFNPHSFRKTLAQLGEKRCRTPEEFKAWSQNLGHEKVLTTFSSYGEVATRRQAQLIKELGDTPIESENVIAQIKQLVSNA